MLQAIIRFSIRNKLVIGLYVLALTGWGIYALSRLPVDALPDITSNQVQVITTSPSLAAPEVERLITFPIEQATANIPGITEMRSISRFGLSVVTIVFTDRTDIYWARQQVAERLNEARDDIPASAGRPGLAPVTTGLGEVFQYVLRPQKGFEGRYGLAELRSIQDWIVRRQLLGTPGVADISSFGGYLKQYEIAVIPEKLKSMGVTMQDLFTALEKNNQNSGGAYIEKGAGALFIRTEGLANSIDDLQQIFIRHTDEGIPVFLKEVAEVRIGHAVRYGAMTYKDEGEVAGAVVLMLKGANASAVIKHVKEKIEQVKKSLPEGVVLETFYDRTKVVNNAIQTVSINLLEGALIVIFILVLFLGHLRAGLIVASVIPLSLLFAVIMMNMFGVSGNLMSLGALDFGLIVDGAVFSVEAVMFRLLNSKSISGSLLISQQQMDEEVMQASGKMMSAAVFGQMIILIVYLPILTLEGIEGKMFRPMAQTVAFALLGAFILSLTYVPMVSSLLLSKKTTHAKNFSDRIMEMLKRGYTPFLRKMLSIPALVVAAAVMLFAVSLLAATRLGGEFIPELEEGDFAVDARLYPGSSLSESIRVSLQAAGLLQRKFPEIEKIVTRIGASEIPTDPMPVEMTDIIIMLKPKSEWVSASTSDALADTMHKVLQEIPGLSTGFKFPIQMRFNELISGARQDVVCKIFGENLDSLSLYVQELGRIISTVPGATDLYVEAATGLPQIVVRYNRASLAHYRLNIEDVNAVVQAAFAGRTAGQVYENERHYDLVVRLQEERRTDISAVEDLLLPAPGGLQVPLSQVATVEIIEGPAQIQRENAARRIIAAFNVRGRDIQSAVKELDKKVNSRLNLPPGYYIRYGGQFQNFSEARNRLAIALPVALLLIFVILWFAFHSLKNVLLIFSAIPLSAIGGILFLWLRSMPFSISAGIGFIALFGVSVLNGIVLITEFNRLRREGLADLKQIVMEGTNRRLRPVLMTASVASLGFLPMAVSQSVGAVVQRPLATVVIGGLITATLLTLVVLPVLYVWLHRAKRGRRKKQPIAFVLFALLLPVAGYSQNSAARTMPLDEMLQRASVHNLSLQISRKNRDYWKELQSATAQLPHTQVGAEYGNINSANNDTRFFISQSFALPVVYRRQRNWYVASEKSAAARVSMEQRELDKKVRTAFFSLVDLLERRRLLERLDSIYSHFLEAAALRLKTGEANVLEKNSAEAQVLQLRLQRQEVDADILREQQQLQWLLNTTDTLLPDYQELWFREALAPDSSWLPQHPALQYQQEQVNVADARVEMERSALSPEFSIGYSNQSIIGYQSTNGVDEKYYDAGDRFGIYQLSVGLPLFTRASKARVRAMKVQSEIARLDMISTSRQLTTQWLQLTEDYKKFLRQISYYEQTGLQQAALMIANANLAFEKGAINYVEWTLLMSNAANIELGYLQAVRSLNQSIIELQYITGK
jgi:cobalt-zinc-cadmium resistance protein CzcA